AAQRRPPPSAAYPSSPGRRSQLDCALTPGNWKAPGQKAMRTTPGSLGAALPPLVQPVMSELLQLVWMGLVTEMHRPQPQWKPAGQSSGTSHAYCPSAMVGA